jgi:hypothetical protein
MARKAAAKEVQTNESSLGDVVILYMKSSSHPYSLVNPRIVSVGEMKFVEGTQVTGRPGHRMEQKRTMVPFDNVASIIAFETEDDLWSEPQAKIVRPIEAGPVSPPLTSHEGPAERHRGGNPAGGGGASRRRRPRGGGRHPYGHGGGGGNFRQETDAQLQERYNARMEREFGR